MVDKTKFLGVMIDEYLSFSPHIQYIKGKISRSLGILYKCKKFFKDSTLVMLYNAFIYPYFTYCVTVWGNTYSSYLDPLIKLQKRAIRLIASLPKRSHTETLFTQYRLLPLAKIYIYSVQLFMYKFHHNKLPAIFSSFYLRNKMVSNRNTRQSNLFHVPHQKPDLKSRSVRCTGVTIYNQLFTKLKLDVSIVTYKKYLKSYLLENEVRLWSYINRYIFTY